MRLILFGAPGSGKGTQAEMLTAHFNAQRVSLGDILRDELKRGTDLGKEVKGYMEKGELVPDHIVSSVIEKKLSDDNYVLDGYPRNIQQAKILEAIFEKKNIELDACIYFEIDEETAVKRLTLRRVCANCGANYHLETMPPKKEGVCDECGKELRQRLDDKPETITTRWQVFMKESQPLLDYYQERSKLVMIDARGNKEEVFEVLKARFSHGQCCKSS